MNVHRFLCLSCLILTTSAINAADLDPGHQLQATEIKSILGEYDGGFVLYDMQTHRWYRYNPMACAKRRSPCSTFKIFNSLCGLESGVLKDENHTYKWDGSSQYMKSWERDHSLTSAFDNSVVWYYQRLAREIGPERMAAFFSMTPYGNGDISGGIDRFWLGDSLEISADEQVAFLARLYTSELPFSERSMKKVRAMMTWKTSGDAVISGKTGTAAANGKRILGWYVGRIKKGDQAFVFALVLDQGPEPSGYVARDKVLDLLQAMSLFQK